MSQNITGVLEKIEVTGPIAGKNGKPDFDRVTFTVGGKTFSKLTNVNADLGLEEGDTVHIFYTSVQNGRFTNNNVIKIETVDSSSSISESTTSTAGTNTKTAKRAEGYLKTQTSPSITLTSGSPTTKDISMEVSGLLQAIITREGLDSETEGKLRTALGLKRRVAQELEQKGSV